MNDPQIPLRLQKLRPGGCLALVLCALSTCAVARAADESGAVTPEGETPANLGRGLTPIVAAYRSERLAGKAEAESFRSALGGADRAQADDRQRVLVEVSLDGRIGVEQAKTECANAGGTVTAAIDWYRQGVVSAWIPLKEVENLAKVPGIGAVHLASRRRMRIGAATSQGVVVNKTNLVNKAGYLGAGVTVGVLSDSYNDDQTDASDYGWTTAAQDVATGDLPGVGNPFGHTIPVQVVLDDNQPNYDTDEGRAMLQIVHDVAPGAKLAFSTAGNSDAEFAANIAKLQSAAKCQVMCDDTGFFDEPMFSDGVVAQAVDAVAAKGVTYFSAFGNDGNSGYEATFSPAVNATGLYQAAAEGVVTSSIPAAERNVIFEWHSFGTDVFGNPIVVQNITTGAAPTGLVFQWDDPFDSVKAGVKGITSDYDILVFNSAGTYLAGRSGTENNIAANEPIEMPAVSLDPGTKFKICIVLTTRVNGAQPRLASRIRYVASDGVDAITGDYIHLNNISGQGHPCAAGCIGVGAYEYDVTPNPAAPAGHVDRPVVEGYSSNGPIHIYFDAAGNRLATPVTRVQPVVSAADNVDTTFFPPDPNAGPGNPNANDYDGDGFPNFAGTSAATPHAAGIGALLIDAAAVKKLGTLTPQKIQSLLVSTTQGSIDEDPLYCHAAAGSVTISDSGDALSTPNVFQISFKGSAGQKLEKVVIDLLPLKMHFDATNSGPFTVVSTTGAPAPRAGSITYAGGPAGVSTVTIPLFNFLPGQTLSFTIGFDDDASGLHGGHADELAGATVEAVVSGVAAPYKGTFANKLGRTYNYKAGFGLVDADAALNLLLKQ